MTKIDWDKNDYHHDYCEACGEKAVQFYHDEKRDADICGPCKRLFEATTIQTLARLGTDPHRTPEQRQREADIDREIDDQWYDE